MHGELTVAPVFKETAQGWETLILMKTGDTTDRYELVATVYGETRPIASMRADLLVRGFNRHGPVPVVNPIDDTPAV